MKKFLCLILIAALLIPVVAFSEVNEVEQRYVGAWTMYAVMKNGTVYNYSLTFTDDKSVYLRTLTIKNGEPSYNSLSSGTWEQLLSDEIYLSLSGATYAANILDSGYLKLMDGNYNPTGYFSRCEDLSSLIGD